MRHAVLTGEHVTKFTDDSSNFGADGPFFHIIREGLKGLAEGEDYFDLLADDVVFEYVVSVPGYPNELRGGTTSSTCTATTTAS